MVAHMFPMFVQQLYCQFWGWPELLSIPSLPGIVGHHVWPFPCQVVISELESL